MSATSAKVADRVLAEVDALRDDLLAAVSEAIRIPSVNPNYPGQVYDDLLGGESDVSRYMAGIYERAGAEVDVFSTVPGRENAVGVVRGRGAGRSLIYCGHVDVVPAGDLALWTSGDPFSGRIDGDRIWGRGSTDMKAGIVAQAFAAIALRQAGVRLDGDLILESVVGEETMDHEAGVTAVCERGYTADAAIVSEPSSPPSPLAVVPVTPSIQWFSVTVKGKAGHASMRGQTFRAGGLGAEIAVSAIDKGMRIFQALRDLEDQWGLTKRHPLYAPGHFTIHPGVVNGGPHGVQVPYIVSEFMTTEYLVIGHPDDDPAETRREIEQQIHHAAQLDGWLREHPPVVEWKLHWPSASVPADHPICQAVGDAHEAAAEGTRFAGRPAVNGFFGAEDTTWLQRAGIPAISYGPGDLRLAHAPDEHCLIDEIVCATKTYAMTALRWCGHSEEG
jgi:acetylornithine deacetylase/succinyl-diaminopimelate desuccinylase family protein